MDSDLFLAIYEEHKQRTGHDIYNDPTETRHIICMVCLHLKILDRKRIEGDKERED